MDVAPDPDRPERTGSQRTSVLAVGTQRPRWSEDLRREHGRPRLGG